MRIEIPTITQEIHLAEYAPEFGDQTIAVRVNPTRGTLITMSEMRTAVQQDGIQRTTAQRFAAMIAKLWENWEADEVMELFEESYDTDPKLFEWLVLKSMTMILEHRAQVKKN